MSGHSKWHNIAVKKGKTDAARGKIFTKIGREIAIAVREGGSNPESNSKLRHVTAKAKSTNMPNDNIKRSIQKASGELGNVDYETITYEGYAPGGVAVIEEKDWIYCKKFFVPATEKTESATLLFEGLDTFCEIYLNGEKLGDHQNMHTACRLEAASRLRRRRQ